MNALDWCRRFVFFWASSPIQGVFNELKYPLIIEPLESLDNPFAKTTVVYGPTQSLKTVFLQCATGYRLDIKRRSILIAAQSDEDSREFSQIKLRPFLERIPTLIDTVRKGRHAITDTHWLWPSHELIISGPGENAQQSKSVCYLHTDEAHRWNLEYPGAMASLDNRMGGRWDRAALHTTTAAKAGTEIDILYHRGDQNEWHIRCVHCSEFFQPLWEDYSKKIYNGHKVFRWIDSQSETETLGSIEMRCPHCDKQMLDMPRMRADMDDGAHYMAMNPGADRMFKSYRWNAFAPRFKSWRDLLAIYLAAIYKAKLGDITPYSDWITKQEARTDMQEYPMMGSSSVGRDYDKADIEIVDESKLRVASFDRQEGKNGEGFHIWGLIDEWERGGNSRRIEYAKLDSWTTAEEFRKRYGVKPSSVVADCGNQVERDVFGACAMYHWYALKSGDELEFPHRIQNFDKSISIVNYPFSEARLENAMVGRPVNKQIRNRPGQVPPDHCLSMLWSKPVIYPILYTLKNGDAGRYYGIARDIDPRYVEQLHSYIPGEDTDKKTNVLRKTIWIKIATDDHSWACSAQSLIVAIKSGFYPMTQTELT